MISFMTEVGAVTLLDIQWSTNCFAAHFYPAKSIYPIIENFRGFSGIGLL